MESFPYKGSNQFYPEILGTFVDREDIITKFEQSLNSVKAGQLFFFAIKGNSGTGKTFLIQYLSQYLCPRIKWKSAQLSFTTLDFRVLLKGLENSFKDCVSPEQLKDYRTKRDGYNYQFDTYHASISITQSIEAKEYGTVAESSLNTKIDMQLRERERQLQNEWSQAFIELIERNKNPISLFIDNYMPSSYSDNKLEKWFWEDLLPQLIKASHYPIVVMICGWDWPGISYIDSHNVIRVELKDFNLSQTVSYLEKHQVLRAHAEIT